MKIHELYDNSSTSAAYLAHNPALGSGPAEVVPVRIDPELRASITWKGWITSVLKVTGTTVTTPCPSSAATVLARLDSGSIEAMSGVRQARPGQ